MWPKHKGILFLAAAISLGAVIFLYDAHWLERRLGSYYFPYVLTWCLVVFGLLLAGVRLVRSLSLLRSVVICLFVGYASTVFSFVLVVGLDVFGIRQTHASLSGEDFLIPLFSPFMLLRGWEFTVLFVLLVAALNILSERISKNPTEPRL